VDDCGGTKEETGTANAKIAECKNPERQKWRTQKGPALRPGLSEFPL
jgi:hypothetical protein